MCDYSNDYTYPAVKDMPKTTERVYCKRAPQFWVQSLLSAHNMHACAHHLARIVREIDDEAKKFDIGHLSSRAGQTDKRYRRFGTHPDDDGRRMTNRDSNYARVTVKPYAP